MTTQNYTTLDIIVPTVAGTTYRGLGGDDTYISSIKLENQCRYSGYRR